MRESVEKRICHVPKIHDSSGRRRICRGGVYPRGRRRSTTTTGEPNLATLISEGSLRSRVIETLPVMLPKARESGPFTPIWESRVTVASPTRIMASTPRTSVDPRPIRRSSNRTSKLLSAAPGGSLMSAPTDVSPDDDLAAVHDDRPIGVMKRTSVIFDLHAKRVILLDPPIPACWRR